MINFTFTDYTNNDTIIIQSCTGTGKTTAVAEHCRNYLKDNKCNILSIISRITLGDQHVKSFKEKNIDMFTLLNTILLLYIFWSGGHIKAS